MKSGHDANGRGCSNGLGAQNAYRRMGKAGLTAALPSKLPIKKCRNTRVGEFTLQACLFKLWAKLMFKSTRPGRKKAQDISVAAKDTVLDYLGVSNKAFCWS